MKTLDQAPAKACLMAGGAVTFADVEEGSKTHPIRMLARSSQAIDHWYWGRVVHDLAGFKLAKPRIAVDYIHDEPIGYLDKFEVTDEGLIVAGALVLTDDPTDPAPKMMKRHRGGVPFEASINFAGDGLKVEILGEGQVAAVNGYQFEGPGMIIREWPLRGVAVCPYGADMHTESEFSRAAETISVTQIAGVTAMKTATPPAAELSADAGQTTDVAQTTDATQTSTELAAEVKTVEQLAATVDPRVEMKRFRDAFGDEGLKWFADGMSFEAAQQQQNSQLADRLAAVETKLAAASQVTGEQTPAGGFSASDPTKERKGFASKLRMPGEPK